MSDDSGDIKHPKHQHRRSAAEELQAWRSGELDLFAVFFHEQQAWSYDTFGPPSHRGPQGPLDHLFKELKESASAPDDLEEYVDCVFLIFDAVHRAGFTYSELVLACFKKLGKNRQRTWPDWRGKDPTKAIEHDRSKDKKEEPEP